MKTAKDYTHIIHAAIFTGGRDIQDKNSLTETASIVRKAMMEAYAAGQVAMREAACKKIKNCKLQGLAKAHIYSVVCALPCTPLEQTMNKESENA